MSRGVLQRFSREIRVLYALHSGAWEQLRPEPHQRRRWSSTSGTRSGSGDGAGGAAAPQPPLPPLKVALKSLYLKVHPDLFTDWPAEQAENQRSFQLLQDYLEAARAAPGNPGPAGRTPYRFRFYLREAAAAAATDSDDDGEGAPPAEAAAPRGGLRTAELTLPPPEPSPAGGGALSPAARKALGRLLDVCGLGADLEAGAEEAAGKARLLWFLPHAAEAVRQAESGAVGWEVQAANIRGAMRLARQVVVGFGGRDIPGPRQLELLRALARVLDELAAEGVDLSGAHIMLGPRTAMDSRGTLWLDASEEDHEAWADFLGGADLAFASARRAAAAGVRRLEEGAAAAAGLAAVFSPAALVMAPEYRTFLERLAKHAADHGPIRSKGGSGGGASSSGGAGSGAGAAGQQQAAAALPFSEVPLYVAPYGSGSAGAGGGSEASSSGGGGGGESSGGGGFDHDVAAHLMFTSSVITDPPPRRAQKFKVRV